MLIWPQTNDAGTLITAKHKKIYIQVGFDFQLIMGFVIDSNCRAKTFRKLRVFKELSEVIFKPLASIFKQSLELGKFRMIGCKVIKYQCIKKGDGTDRGNYRSASLTCITCKLLESFIRDKPELFI